MADSPDEPDLPRPGSGQPQQQTPAVVTPVKPVGTAAERSPTPEPAAQVAATEAHTDRSAPTAMTSATTQAPMQGPVQVQAVPRIMDPLNPKRSLAEIHGCEPAKAADDAAEKDAKEGKKDEKVTTRRSSRRNAGAAPPDEVPLLANAALGGAKAPVADYAVTVRANTLLPPPPAPGETNAVPHLFQTCPPRGDIEQKTITAPRRQPMRAAKSMQKPEPNSQPPKSRKRRGSGSRGATSTDGDRPAKRQANTSRGVAVSVDGTERSLTDRSARTSPAAQTSSAAEPSPELSASPASPLAPGYEPIGDGANAEPAESDRKLRGDRGASTAGAAAPDKKALASQKVAQRRSQGQRAAAAAGGSAAPGDKSDRTSAKPPAIRQSSIRLDDIPVGEAAASLAQRADLKLSKGLLDGSVWKQDHAAALKQFCQELEGQKDNLDALSAVATTVKASSTQLAAALGALAAAPAWEDKQTVQKPKATEMQALQRFVTACGTDRHDGGRDLPKLLEQVAKRLHVELPGWVKPTTVFTEAQVQERISAAVRKAVDEERRNAATATETASREAEARLTQALQEKDTESAAAVSAAHEVARQRYMQSHAVPAVDELARSLPSEERRNAMCIIASCLAPQWQLATLAAGIEDSVHRLHGDSSGAASAAYRAQVTALVAHLCPEGFPGVWMPSEAQQSSWDRALADGGKAPPEDWTPQGVVGDQAMRTANAIRGEIWGGHKTFLEAADLQFESKSKLPSSGGKQP